MSLGILLRKAKNHKAKFSEDRIQRAEISKGQKAYSNAKNSIAQKYGQKMGAGRPSLPPRSLRSTCLHFGHIFSFRQRLYNSRPKMRGPKIRRPKKYGQFKP